MAGNRNGTHRAAASACLAANLLPVALVFYFIHRYGVDVPVGDEWDGFVARVFELRDQGQLGIVALASQHNEHRLLFPRLITLANAALFHWDRRVEMYVSALILLFATAVLFRMTREYWNDRLSPLYFIPIAWTLMSWRQYANLLVGFQTQIFLCVAGAVTVFWLLRTSAAAGKRTWLAVAAAFVATFSFGASLIIWPVGAMQLLLRQCYGAPDEKPQRLGISIWIGAGVTACALYFAGYHGSDYQWPHGPVYFLRHLQAAAEYVTIVLGSPFSFRLKTALAMGVMIEVVLAYALFLLIRLPKKHLVDASALLSLMTFTLLTAGALGYGRLALGNEEALASRYCTLIVPGLLAVYAVLVKCSLTTARTGSLAACLAMVVLLACGAINGYPGWSDDPAAVYFRYSMRAGQFALRNAHIVDDTAFLFIHPRPVVVREGIRILRAHGYSIFRERPPESAVPVTNLGQSSGCFIDTINGTVQNPIEVHRHSGAQAGLDVSGWAVDTAAHSLPGRVFATIDGTLDFPAITKSQRPDVAAAYQNAAYQESGVASYIKLSLIPDGEHTLSFKIVNQAGSGYWTCAGGPAPRVVRVME